MAQSNAPSPADSVPSPGADHGKALALHVFRELQKSGLVDRMLVLRACEERLPDAAGSDKELLYERAAMRCRDELGEVPSKSGYATWRDERPDKGGLPSASAVANMFGGWAGVRDRLGQPTRPDVLTRRLTATGPRIVVARPRRTNRSIAAQAQEAEREDLVAVLQTWADLHPDDYLTQPNVLRWTRSEREKERPCLRFLPSTDSPFRRCFAGGWTEAVETAGLTHRRPRRKDGATKRSRQVEAAYEGKQLRKWLELAAADLGCHMTEREYLSWAGDVPRRVVDRLGSEPPASTLSQKHYAGFVGAMVACGFITREEGAERRAKFAGEGGAAS